MTSESMTYTHENTYLRSTNLTLQCNKHTLLKKKNCNKHTHRRTQFFGQIHFFFVIYYSSRSFHIPNFFFKKHFSYLDCLHLIDPSHNFNRLIFNQSIKRLVPYLCKMNLKTHNPNVSNFFF